LAIAHKEDIEQGVLASSKYRKRKKEGNVDQQIQQKEVARIDNHINKHRDEVTCISEDSQKVKYLQTQQKCNDGIR